MAKPVKTNVMRRLEALRIPYEALTYPVDEEHLDGMHAAHALGMDPRRMFKTLVLLGDEKAPLVCCIPVDRELDLKAAARVSGHKSVRMLHQRDLLALTGYVRGGCSPIGMKKALPTYIDRTVLDGPQVAVSAGARGCQVLLAPQALVDCVHATLVELTHTAPQEGEG